MDDAYNDCLHFASDLLQDFDLDLLTQELSGVNQKWENIGRELDVSTYGIRLMHSDPVDRLREVLREQLKKLHNITTWRNIVDILRTHRVGESQLADQLNAKYCPSEFTNIIAIMYDICTLCLYCFALKAK